MAKKISPPHIDAAAAPVMAARAQAAETEAAAVGITLPWPEILAVFMALVKALAACGVLAAQASRAMNHPNHFQDERMWRICLKQAKRNQEKAGALYAACKSQGSTVTEADAVSMYHEAGVMMPHEHG